MVMVVVVFSVVVVMVVVVAFVMVMVLSVTGGPGCCGGGRGGSVLAEMTLCRPCCTAAATLDACVPQVIEYINRHGLEAAPL